MMHFFSRFFLSCSMALLVACVNPNVATCVNLCKKSCVKQFEVCNQVCRNNCPQCSKAVSCVASKNYNKYKNEQKIQGGIIARDLNSYRDPLQCRKVTCNCLADYNVCTQSCEGIIHKRLQPVPSCC